MAFWGLALKPNSSQGLGDKVDGGILHLSQACLSNTKPGKSYLEVGVEGSKYRICCLEEGKIEHISCDLFFGDKETTFYNKGASEIHLTGYIEPENDEMDEEEEEEEDEPAPPAAKKAATPKASPKVEPKVSPKVSPKAEPKAAVAKSSPKKAPEPAPVEDDDSGDEEEGEEEELEGEEEEILEDEESEEEEDEPAPKAKAKAAAEKGAKRKEAPAPEPPAKKKKGEAAASPASKPADSTAAYLGKLKEYLKTNGATNLGILGSKVPKPDGVPKLGKLLGEHKDKFKIENQIVTAL